MTQKFKQVPVKGITAEELFTLWREGKLYLKEETLSYEELLARCQQEAIVYVSSIDEFVLPEWRPYIKEIWETIFCNESFAPLLVIKKGKMKGRLNRYVVTNIVSYLLTLNVYHNRNLVELHKILEKVDKKNSIYKCAVQYCFSKKQLRKIEDIAKNISGLK